jgi:hypothetical protein
MPFVREEQQLAQEQPNGRATNDSREIRRVANDPIGEHVFDLLPMILCSLLVWKGGNSLGFVAVLKNCGNHKKTSVCQTSDPLDLRSGG